MARNCRTSKSAFNRECAVLSFVVNNWISAVNEHGLPNHEPKN